MKGSSMHSVMRFLAEQYGPDILESPRLSAMIYDILGERYLMRNVMERAVASQLGLRIIDNIKNDSYEVDIATTKYIFQEENFLRPQVADYIVESFLYALNKIPEPLLPKETNPRNDEPVFGTCQDGDYCGYRDDNGERSGFGILKNTQDGSYYAGYWRLDTRMGLGIGYRKGWGKYIGNWRLNRPNGVGTLITDSGLTYSGMWKNGLLEKFVYVYYPNGEIMLAYFVHGQIDNRDGMYYMQDGSEIHGKMTIKGPTGQCKHVLLNGSSVIEYWNDGKIIKN